MNSTSAGTSGDATRASASASAQHPIARASAGSSASVAMPAARSDASAAAGSGRSGARISAPPGARASRAPRAWTSAGHRPDARTTRSDSSSRNASAIAPIMGYSRARMKIWMMYQNISATDENSASAAAT